MHTRPQRISTSLQKRAEKGNRQAHIHTYSLAYTNTHTETLTHSLKAGTFYFMKGQTILTSQLANVPHTQKRTQTHIHTHAHAHAYTHALNAFIFRFRKGQKKKYTALAHIHTCSLAP